jgi:hypothetical protein
VIESTCRSRPKTLQFLLSFLAANVVIGGLTFDFSRGKNELCGDACDPTNSSRGGSDQMAGEGTERLGLEFTLQRPEQHEVDRIPESRDGSGKVLYPEIDADGDHVHFEMVPMGGDSLLWLTVRRGIGPELAASSLRKIADLIDRHGERLLTLLEGVQGSIDAGGDMVSGPLRLTYDEHGDMVIPE